MKKKAQIIGMDLVMGVSIFLIAISVFFVMIRDSNTLISDKSINDVANYIMSNVENVPTTCSNCDFLEGSKFIKFNFGLFAGTGYAEKKSYILGDVDKLGFKEMIFCIYVKDYEGKIITYTGNNTIELSSGKNCNSEGEINKEDVNLKCPIKFTQSFVLSEPVFYYSNLMNERKLANVNILVCANEE